MGQADYDLCVIGGGINGVGIARDAALQGLKVCLLEQYDLAAGTSSSSTKIIHGGLRYLEKISEWGMVREALIERDRLMTVAPHLITPMKFILPHDASQRPGWMIRIGLFLYDHLCFPHKLGVPRSRKENLSGGLLKDDYQFGFSYYDGWTNDADLVRANAKDSAKNGADIFENHPVKAIKETDGQWHIEAGDKTISAKMAVNATGPWVQQFCERFDLHEPDLPNVRMVKGSHILIPRLHDADDAYILQQPDGRIIFVIPYNETQTLIGTTEEEYEGDPIDAKISKDEMAYLCAAFNRSFKQQITPGDIVETYSGIRPLIQDDAQSASKTSRDHMVYRHAMPAAPLWSLYGGKLTTHRSFAEEVTREICRELDRPYQTKTRTEAL